MRQKGNKVATHDAKQTSNRETDRYRSRLVVGLLLEQQGVRADAISAQQLLQAENIADSIMQRDTSDLRGKKS